MRAFIRFIALRVLGRRAARLLPGGWIVFALTSPRVRRMALRGLSRARAGRRPRG